MAVLSLHHITDTTLYKQLSNGFSGPKAALASILAANVISICEEAALRMKSFPAAHPQYTLHDEVHLLRVTELMAKILGEDGLAELNPIEIYILILCAHLHDQGMVLEEVEFSALDSDATYTVFAKDWTIKHQTLNEVRIMLSNKDRGTDELTKLRRTEQELLSALYTDYVRITHGVRSATHILARYGNDERFRINGVNIAPLIAKLAASHVKPAFQLSENNGFNLDESIGDTPVNIVYLGLILRLADILDFDRDRTPDSLYRSIHFTSPVSLQEWEKHRAVTGWTIEPKMIRYTAACEHPEYQRAILSFMDWIDDELAACRNIVQSFPKGFDRYQLNLPATVDRDRIRPKDGAYIYHDLEFSLSRDQIIKLLMTDKLYGASDLCIRELLQNSLDALRLRRATMLRDSGIVWTKGTVQFEHQLDDNGYEVVRCIDNGAGMDINIITNFLTNVGRSYYRSPEFEQERYSLQLVDADFEPIGQFGIGFMSCFMLGDKIKITTRKDYGLGLAHGPSLLVEINGLGGIVSIKELETAIPVGTTIEITCGKFNGLLNRFYTKAHVVATVNTVAVAAEFPISANCTIPENAEEVVIPPIIHNLRTPQEKAALVNVVTANQDFNSLNSLLQGNLKETFLLDAEGNICTENDEAAIEPGDINYEKSRRSQHARLVSRKGIAIPEHNIQRISFDGIYICGDSKYMPAEDGYYGRHMYMDYGINIRTGKCTFTLNVRGNLKAALTPARGPLNRSSYGDENADAGWRRLEGFTKLAQANIYDRLISGEFGSVTPEVCWKLIAFNGLDLRFINMSKAWDNISLPFTDIDNKHQLHWIPLRSLNRLQLGHFPGGHIATEEGLVCMWQDYSLWSRPQADPLSNKLASFLLAFCNINLLDGKLVLTPRQPDNPNSIARNSIYGFGYYSPFSAVPYVGELYDCINLPMNLRTVNSSHPVIKFLISQIDEPNESYMIRFLSELLHMSMYDFNEFKSVLSGENQISADSQRLGLLYGLIDWSQYAVELGPPYKLYMHGGKLSLEAKDFIFLRDNGPCK